jgi:hypothetical protein
MSLILASTPNKKGRSSFKLWNSQISLAMGMELGGEENSRHLEVKVFLILCSSESLQQRERDSGGEEGRCTFCSFQWILKFLMLRQSGEEEGVVQRQCY